MVLNLGDPLPAHVQRRDSAKAKELTFKPSMTVNVVGGHSSEEAEQCLWSRRDQQNLNLVTGAFNPVVFIKGTVIVNN